MSTDWLPSREQDFTDLCRKWKTGLETPATVSVFGWNQAEVTAVLGTINAFLTALTAYEGDDSSGNRLTKDEAKDAAKSAMRDFANTSIRYNKRMTDEDRLNYGIRPLDKTATPGTEPRTYPEAETDTSVIRQLTIGFWDSATKKRGKPHGVHGAEIRWAQLDSPRTVQLGPADLRAVDPVGLATLLCGAVPKADGKLPDNRGVRFRLGIGPGLRTGGGCLVQRADAVIEPVLVGHPLVVADGSVGEIPHGAFGRVFGFVLGQAVSAGVVPLVGGKGREEGVNRAQNRGNFGLVPAENANGGRGFQAGLPFAAEIREILFP